jgi:hypothetical protein
VKIYFKLPIIISSLILAACTGSKTDIKDAMVTETVPVPTDSLVDGPTWTINLPLSWNKEISTAKYNELLARQSVAKGIVALTVEPYTGTFDQFNIEVIRGFRGQGVKVTKLQSVYINDSLFVQVELTQADADTSIDVTAILTVKNGYGYSLDCGLPSTSEVKFDCQKILSSFKLK